MKPAQTITSVALFCGCDRDQPIPLSWFERVVTLFDENRLSPIYFTAGGDGFVVDDCCLLADGGGPIYSWGDPAPILPRRSDLIKALQQGTIDSLDLDSPREDSTDRSNWRGSVSLSSSDGAFYAGIEEQLVYEPVALLRRAYDIARELLDVRYGFGYKMPLADEPNGYASGFVKTSAADVFAMIRHRREWESRKRSPDELWRDELWGKRRHLDGLFRGAYPVNLLSASHVESARLASHCIGRLSPLDESLWLWELSETELPNALQILEAENALVSQQTVA